MGWTNWGSDSSGAICSGAPSWPGLGLETPTPHLDPRLKKEQGNQESKGTLFTQN